jgi:hypothetical protein
MIFQYLHFLNYTTPYSLVVCGRDGWSSVPNRIIKNFSLYHHIQNGPKDHQLEHEVDRLSPSSDKLKFTSISVYGFIV